MIARTNSTVILDLSRECFKRGSSVRFRVTGRSMKPFLRGGESVTVNQTPAASLKLGDLILYRSREGPPVIHRIVARHMHKNSLAFLTKGDGLKGMDAPVASDQIMGRVSVVETLGPTGARTLKLLSLRHRLIALLIALSYRTKCHGWRMKRWLARLAKLPRPGGDPAA